MLPDKDKTKEQLVSELALLRQRNTELATSEIKRRRAEEALRESEEFSSSLLTNSPNAILVTNPDTSVRYVNPALEKLTGFTSTEVIGRKAPYPWWTQETLQKISRDFEEALDKGAERAEQCFQKKNGERFWVEITAAPVIRDGEFKYYLANWVDITERKQAEEALRESEERYRALVNLGAEVGEAVTMAQDTEQGEAIHIFVNDEWPRITGYSREELLGMSFFDLLRPKHREASLKRHRSKTRGESIPGLFEVTIIRKDGTEVPIELTSAYTMYKGERANVAYIRDITERKRAEEALRESEGKYRTLFELGSDALFLIEVETGRILDLNDTALKMYGYSREEALQMKNTDFSAEPAQTRQATVEHEQQIPVRYHKKKDGTIFPTDISVAYFTWYGKEVCIAAIRDITERKRTEEALKASEQEKSGILNAISDSMVFQDKSLSILWVNNAGTQLMGKSSQELVGQHCYELWHGRNEPCEKCPVLETLETGAHTDGTMTTPDGRQWKIEGEPVRNIAGEIIGAIEVARDITERKQVEEALRESEERYRALVNLGAEVGEAVTMSHDTEQGEAIHIFVNDEWPRITGYSREELLGMSFFDLVHPEHREASLKRHRSKMSGEAIPGLFEVTIIRKDGTEVPIELTGAHTTYHGKPANVAYMRDITERKQAEEREKELQQELSLSRRLAAVGELAAGVAHEINNPLTGVLGFSERLLRKSTDEEIRRDLERIHSEAQRIVKVMDNLRTFTRRREPEKQYSDINGILQTTLELRAYELKTGNIEVVTNFIRSLPEIEVDFHQIQEVFLNLILNAEQVMTEARGEGRLIIKTREIKDYVRISFTDDGPGISAEHLDKLFDLFFTTREEKGGTGLGLSVCHGIVAGHGGRLYAKSKPGQGATFFVDLPCREQG